MGCSTGENVLEDKKPINNAINSNENKDPVKTNELGQHENDLIEKIKIGICRVLNKKINSSSMGILCKLPLPDKIHSLPILITNSKVLNENTAKEVEEIWILGNEGFSKILNLNLKRKSCFSIDNISVIQILPDEGFNKDILDSFLNIYQYKTSDKNEILKLDTYAFYLKSDLSVSCMPFKIEFIDKERNTFVHQRKEEFTDFILLDKNTFTLIGFHEFDLPFGKPGNLGILMEKVIKSFPMDEIDDEKNNNEQGLLLDYIMMQGETSIRIFGEQFVKNNKGICKYKNIDMDEEFKEVSEFYNTVVPFNQHVKLRVKLIGIKNIKNFAHMCDGCDHLFEVGNIDILNENDLTDISYMFNGCEALTKFGDISKFKTDNITNMEGFFCKCNSLNSCPDISNWNIEKVTSIAKFFYECVNLTSLPDISKWNTKNVEKIEQIFMHCYKLLEVPDISKWNISKVKALNDIFYDCRSLKSIPDISKWDVKNIINITGLFGKC